MPSPLKSPVAIGAGGSSNAPPPVCPKTRSAPAHKVASTQTSSAAAQHGRHVTVLSPGQQAPPGLGGKRKSSHSPRQDSMPRLCAPSPRRHFSRSSESLRRRQLRAALPMPSADESRSQSLAARRGVPNREPFSTSLTTDGLEWA